MEGAGVSRVAYVINVFDETAESERTLRNVLLTSAQSGPIFAKHLMIIYPMIIICEMVP